MTLPGTTKLNFLVEIHHISEIHIWLYHEHMIFSMLLTLQEYHKELKVVH